MIDPIVSLQRVVDPRTKIAARHIQFSNPEAARLDRARKRVGAPRLAARTLLQVEEIHFDGLTRPVSEGQISQRAGPLCCFTNSMSLAAVCASNHRGSSQKRGDAQWIVALMATTIAGAAR